MFNRLVIFLASWLVIGVCAANSLEVRNALTSLAHSSLSGQFVTHDALDTDENLFDPGDSMKTNLVQIDSTLLGVSCERIKKGLLNQLGADDRWQGKVYFYLHHFRSDDEAISVMPVMLGHNWVYRIDLPDRVERDRLVSAVVEVLLLEIANRNTDKIAQIPTWLSLGMAREVALSSQLELILETPKQSPSGMNMRQFFRSEDKPDSLAQVHRELSETSALTVDELSWPGEGSLVGTAGEAYRGSAQLFVHSLLALNDGHACLRTMLPKLPNYLNWQLAFFEAFHGHFANPLELEKWWTLRVMQFTGRDMGQTWPTLESWNKLDEAVRASVEVRTKADELPLHSQVDLQTVIRDWDTLRQTELLKEKAHQLLLLRFQVSPQLAPLADGYRRTIAEYLRKRDRVIYFPTGKIPLEERLDPVANKALRDLDQLDAWRAQMRPPGSDAQPVARNSSVNN